MTLAWADVRTRVVGLGVGLDDVAVMGSAPLLACGALATVGDVDLVARGAAWDALASRGAVAKGDLGDLMIDLDDDVQAFSGWHGRPAEAVLAACTRVDGVCVGPVEWILEYKRRLDRPKDRAHLAQYAAWAAARR